MTANTARILAVDDEENIREMLRRGLERTGYEVVTAESAGRAANLLDGEEFDLVLLDITMPGKSGIDFLPEIIAKYPELAVIMLTGIADVSTGVRAMREGAHDYVNKRSPWRTWSFGWSMLCPGEVWPWRTEHINRAWNG